MLTNKWFRRLLFLFLALNLTFPLALMAGKPPLTLDDFFNAVSFTAVKLSPNGHSLVIGTERADWKDEIFRKDLWLYRDDGKKEGTLVQLTQSGYDTDPQWSPDGHWIAFLSTRKTGAVKADDDADPGKKETAQLYLIAPAGGEAFPVTQGQEAVHAFAWSADSRTLYFATRTPWTKAQNDAHKQEWKDVDQYRESERGDVIFSLNVAGAVARRTTLGSQLPSDKEKEPPTTPDAVPLATSNYQVKQLAASPDGSKLAFVTTSISQRVEAVEPYEIYLVNLADARPQLPPRQLTRNQAIENDFHWAPDSRHLFFAVGEGSVEGKYEDLQKRVYWVDTSSGEVRRWASQFGGPTSLYDITPEGALLAPARLGTEVQVYLQSSPTASFAQLPGWPGTYDNISTAAHSPRVAFLYSALPRPAEVYLAEGPDKLQQARAVTAFNKLLSERELPQGKPYRWQADDGSAVEGMLLYPPGKFGAQHLPMFTLIHGGPADADGNYFEADWYQWAALAATEGWLVFEPNYRGSSGYGDKFMKQIVPQIVSRPGKDILEGIDALLKDGIADPDHLTVGGYSYGGYMTNWLITQTARFKAAVTGAGAVEHAANWGNDDLTLDDAYYLGGAPWEVPQRYQDEAALFQINKVRTPTHMVAGGADIRVAVLEDYLLERALHALNVPCSLLIFPGEGHSLARNPWHGRIKVREELKWLQKYGGVGSSAPSAGR